MRLDRLEGKFKLSQDKKPADIAGVIAALDERGDAASLAVAHGMRILHAETRSPGDALGAEIGIQKSEIRR